MPSPQLQAYLAAREKALALDRACDEAVGTSAELFQALEAAILADTARCEALAPLLPARIAAQVRSTSQAACLEDEFVWFRLLVEEFGGNREAAENAWALGQRPNGYPEGIRCE